VASLKGKGVDARAIELKPTVRHDQAIAALRAARTQKSVLLTLLMMELLFQDPDVVKALQP